MPQAQQLGRYLLLDRLAFGGMAEIFRAKTFDSEGRAHLVAVKRVLQHLTADDDFLHMLVDEAKVTATLRHENIARVYEFSHADDEYFIAMEYVDGKDVRSLIERQRLTGRPIPPEHAAWIVMEVAHGLNAAHTQRDGAGQALHIVHRDVSPSNLLCSYGGEVKLCDFGIAKATLTRVQTKTGIIKGKVKYMSPEQAMGRKLDHRSDLFSLGAVMYEMLTLEAPFQAASEVELIFAVRDAHKKDAREIERSIPTELDEILNRVMMRSRSARFQSGRELALALRGFLEHYRPGYRRSHFGRYMRSLFAEDIERELRILEEYVIESADPRNVGENLIADVLGENPVYTQFAAAQGGPGPGASIIRTGRFPRVDAAPSPDLHAEDTRILTRNQPRAGASQPEPSALHSQPTLIFNRQGAAAGQPETRKLEAAAIHDLDTRILALPQAAPATGGTEIAPTHEDEGTQPHAIPPELAVEGSGPVVDAGNLLQPLAEEDDSTDIRDEEPELQLADEDLEPA